jgi:hypothetical protein
MVITILDHYQKPTFAVEMMVLIEGFEGGLELLAGGFYLGLLWSSVRFTYIGSEYRARKEV